ncbi:unnamed protein product [Haemonchus placei]|uniref:Uncharacterized protein n=1 Tax=Haemonchus placei TaxID=6290 RepID=A0A3P7WB86_HAEPC|nr:unnamed protein product [Haemonchus placei]
MTSRSSLPSRALPTTSLIFRVSIGTHATLGRSWSE